jgi:hypothetical protein
MTLERPKLAVSRIETIQETVDKVYEFSGKLEDVAGNPDDPRRYDFKTIAKQIDAVIAESSLTTVDRAERTLDQLDDLKNSLNRKGDRLDAQGEKVSASAYWEASEGLADLITENDTI